MKKRIVAIIIFATILFIAGCVEHIPLAETNEPYETPQSQQSNITPITPITQSNTFNRQLDAIMQQAETHEPLAQSEHDVQLHRLRQFAKNLNNGGTELSDLRIARIWGRPGRSLGTWCERTQQGMQVSFDMTLMHEDDFYNEEFIAEMLTYAGISEDDISINLNHTGYVVVWGQTEHFDFMLGNQAVYDFVRPYLRLREFAANANTGTIRRDDVLVTMVNDYHQQQPIGMDLPAYSYPRFSIGLSPLGAAQAGLTDIMLAYAGLTPKEVRFQTVDAHSWYTEQDFLRVNQEMGQFYQQFERLYIFANLTQTRSVRRDIVMDIAMLNWSPAGSRGAGSGFTAGFSAEHYENERLREVLLAFTGIDAGNIDFELSGMVIAGWAPTRRDLTPEQSMYLDNLEAFMLSANAPFWYDKYLHDPVIVRIGLDGDWNFNTNVFHLSYFNIMLYDPSLLDLSEAEFERRTATLKEEIITITGVENIRISAFESLPWGAW